MTSTGASPDIHFIETVDSTLNELARAHNADPHLADFSTVVAGHQKAGRGRSGRTWSDINGTALLMSTLVRIDNQRLSWITLVAGIAVARVLSERGIDARLKWPNDVIVDDRKVCGILAEHLDVDVTTGIHTIALGIGLNLESAPEDAGPVAGAIPLLPSEHSTTARLTLARAIVEQIQNLLDASVTSWHREYSNLFLHFDTPTSIRLPGSSAQVLTPIRVDEAGALIARDESGAETTFTVADVDLPIPLHPTDSLASPAVHAPRKGANA